MYICDPRHLTLDKSPNFKSAKGNADFQDFKNVVRAI